MSFDRYINSINTRITLKYIGIYCPYSATTSILERERYIMRIAIGIEYDGSNYHGWQRQKDHQTIQSVVEKAVSQVANEPVSIVCAGRTDSGVHALEQVAHFDSEAKRDTQAWLMGTNAYLPEDIRIIWAKKLNADFHARTSAIARFYRYTILNRSVASALLKKQVTWHPRPLDVHKMQEAANFLIGSHDFSSFRAQACQSRSPFRTMYFINVQRKGDTINIVVSANAFLHHMVRNIAGVLIDVGNGKNEPEWVAEILAMRNRKDAGVTAPPYGLYLGSIFYPECFGIPKNPVFDQLPDGISRIEHQIIS